MFRSLTIIRELALYLAKVIFMLKHSVELHRYLLCGSVEACHGMLCVLHAVHATHTPFHDMLPLNLAKVIFMLKHSVKLRRYLLCCCVAACHRVVCLCCMLCMQHKHHSMTCCHITA